jgi:hypothetical protein
MRRNVMAVLIGVFTVLALAPGSVSAKPRAIPLNAEQETTGSTSTGSGFFSYTIEGDQLCYTLEVRDLTMAPFAAHLHPGARHVNGPAAVGLLTPPAATSTVSDCITAVEGAGAVDGRAGGNRRRSGELVRQRPHGQLARRRGARSVEVRTDDPIESAYCHCERGGRPSRVRAAWLNISRWEPQDVAA